MTTEVVLKNLFDFQKYQNNEKLKSIIDGTIDRIEFGRELDDSEVELYAAGDPDIKYYNLAENKDD